MRWQFVGGVPEDKRRAFVFTNVTDAKGRSYDIPVVVGALAASPEIYAIGMGRKVEEIGDAWMAAIAHPIAPVMVGSAPCQEVVITGDELKAPGGLAALPVPVSTPGFDSAPYLTATLCVTRDPETGVQNMGTYRAALKAADRLVVRMVAREATGAGGFLHWLKYRERKEPMPIAIVIGAAPVVMFTGPQKLAIDLDELGVAGALAGEPIRTVKCKTVDLHVPADAEIVIEGVIDPQVLEPEAPFGESNGYVALEAFNMPMRVTAITRKQKPVFCSIISQVTPSESSVIKKVAYEPLFLSHLRDTLGDQGRPPRRHARAADQPAAGDLPADRLRHAAHGGVARARWRLDADVELRQDRRRGERRHRSDERRRGAVVARLSLQSARGRAARALSRRRAGRAIRPGAVRFEHADRRHAQAPDGAAGATDAASTWSTRGNCGSSSGCTRSPSPRPGMATSSATGSSAGKHSPAAPPPATGSCPARRRSRASARRHAGNLGARGGKARKTGRIIPGSAHAEQKLACPKNRLRNPRLGRLSKPRMDTTHRRPTRRILPMPRPRT